MKAPSVADKGPRKNNIPTDIASEILEAMHMGFILCRLDRLDDDESLRLLAFNDAASRVAGHDLKNLIGCNVSTRFEHLKECGALHELATVVRELRPITIDSLDYQSKSQGRGVFALHAFPLRDHHLGVLLENITPRVEVEEAYRTVVTNTAQATLVLQDDRIIFANPATETLFPGDPSLDGQPVDCLIERVHPEDRLRVALLLRESIETCSGFSTEHRLRLPDASTAAVEVTAAPIEFRGCPALQLAYADRTRQHLEQKEKDRLQASLLHSQKMQGIATLASGIAHEFNNSLTNVLNNLDLVEQDLLDASVPDSNIQSVRQATTRLTELTRQLLAYSGGGRYCPIPIALDAFVSETTRILRHSLRDGVTLKLALGAPDAMVEADPAQLQMVLSGLVQNAVEAIVEMGQIVIATWSAPRDTTVSDDELEPGTWLSLQDDGEGMSAETADHIFEPFYSTRLLGRGLGMSAVHGIVTAQGGSIEINSALDEGTEVRIWLPKAEVRPSSVPG